MRRSTRALCLCSLVVLVLGSCCAQDSSQEEIDDRLLLSVRKPAVVNSTFNSLTVGFYTGPNLLTLNYEIKCVNETSSCDAPSEGTPIRGTLPSAPSYVTGTVENLIFNTTYWCYALSSTKKVTKCQGPLVATTSLPQGGLVPYTLWYRVGPSFFTPEKQEQVCKNLLAITPNGTCVVDTVVPGSSRSINSSEISGSVEYSDYLVAQQLFEDLSNPSNETLNELITGIVNNTDDVAVVSVSFEFVSKSDSPGPPGFVMDKAFGQTNATITWLDGKLGTPEETYDVNCVASSGFSAVCSDSGVNVTGIPRGIQSATVVGLLPNTTYSCWAIATNPSGTVCSAQPTVFRTLIPPGSPSNVQEVSISNVSTTVSWTDGLEGNPTETYSVKCVNGTSTTCASDGITTSGISRGSGQGTVYGLTPNTTYQCWVIAENDVGSSCSATPVEVRTWIEAGEPICPAETAITNTSVTIDWEDGAQANPEETYTVNCVQNSATACTSLEIYTSNITRGTQSAVVVGLTPNTTYYCYVFATNPVATTCSTSLSISTYIEPGAPTNPQNPSISTSWARVTWDDGALGRPQEQYSVNCVVSSGSASCTDVGVQVTGIARGVQSANVTGLSSNTTYSCWPIAGNVVDSVCSSSPVTNRTWIPPGSPSNVSVGTISSTSVPFSWLDGDEGNPVESYSIICTTDTTAPSCENPAGVVKQATDIPRGSQTGIITGLTADLNYKCWVKAVNDAGGACSSEQLIKTSPQLAVGQVVSYDQAISIVPSAYTPPIGAVNITYQAQCLSSSVTACDPQASGTGALQPSPGSSSTTAILVPGLTNDIAYQCFSVASYTVNSERRYACSGPYSTKPFTQPQALAPVDVVSGNQQLIITPSFYTTPSGGSNVEYQMQCLDASATSCNPLANGTGVLQPSPGQSSTSAIVVSGLTNNVTYQCFSVAVYQLNSQTQYTCSPGFAAIPAPAPTLSTGGVIAGSGTITITPDAYNLPPQAYNISYQVQCFQSITTVCVPSASPSPSPGLSSPGPIELSSLNDRSTYSCFSVVSYKLNGSERYTCSSVFNAIPYTPPTLNAGDVIAGAQQVTVTPSVYTPFASASNVQYQAQCLSSSATICDPLATGTGAVKPIPAQSSTSAIVVPGLTNNVTYLCFSVVSYTVTSGVKYTCSSGISATPVAPPASQWTSQNSAADNQWLSVTWGGQTGDQKFVAVSQTGTGNRVMTSPNGVNWTTQASAADNAWQSVAWGGPSGDEKFVAVGITGTGDRVMTSPDGVNWTTQASAADNEWVSITWGGPSGQEKFVAVASSGTGNRVMTSPNGVNWTIQSTPANNNWKSVTWGGPSGQERFVAVASSGSGDRVMISTDGVGWSTQSSAANNDWKSVTWGGPSGDQKFVAVAVTGSGNRVMTSTNGISWTLQSSPADYSWNSVIWGGLPGEQTFVAVAQASYPNVVMTSPDGVTWTTQTAAASNSWSSVTWGGPSGQEKFVAVSATGTGNRVMTSP